jgi:hypothetical protein
MALLAFDPARLDSLRLAMGAALDDLLRVRSDDPATANAMRMIRAARGSLADLWLPRINDVLRSKSMSESTHSKLTDEGGGRSAYSPPASGPLWTMTRDPGVQGIPSSDPVAMCGPKLLGSRSFGEVLVGIQSGALRSMTPPLDANGRAGAHYTSLAIAPGTAHEVGHADLTSDLSKFVDFWSDGMPIGWRENTALTILYLSNARVVNTVHVLEAYDRDTGPAAVPGQTTEATVSGYLVLRQATSTAEVNVQIGPGEQDPTQSFPIISETSSNYSGEFFPDSPPDFEPITGQPRFVQPAAWTFTTSASPMVDGWGTYRI